MTNFQWIQADSPYLVPLNLSGTEDYAYANQLILSKQAFLEKYCNRTFAQQTFDEQVMVLQDRSLMLRNTPIQYIARVCVAAGNWLTIKNTTATIANVATTPTTMVLTSVVNGITATNTLTLASTPTLTALAVAITALGSGWTASVAIGYGNYPSQDITPNQIGNATTGYQPYIWQERSSAIRFDVHTGILPGYGGSYDTNYQSPTFPLQGTMNTALIRGDLVRVVYSGGYDPIPEDLKEVLSHLVIQAFESPMGRKSMETIGNQYTFNLMDFDKAPASDRKIIGQYRRRQV